MKFVWIGFFLFVCPGPASLQIISAAGSIVQHRSLNLTQGVNTISLDELMGYANGNYTIKISGGNRSITRQIIIAR